MNSKAFIFVCALYVLIVSQPACAIGQEEMSKPDIRVRKLLHKADLKYTITDKGNYRVDFEIKGTNRHHWVFISSHTDVYNGMETRRIWATAYKSDEAPSKEITSELLMDNVRQKIGAWELTRREDGYRVLFRVCLPVEVSPETFNTAVRVVLFAADEMEKKLTNGKDEF